MAAIDNETLKLVRIEAGKLWNTLKKQPEKG